MLKAAFGGRLPDVVWDGLGKPPIANDPLPILSLGVPGPDVGMAEAKPALLNLIPPPSITIPVAVGAPAALDTRARP